jgi:hypothetical protein
MNFKPCTEQEIADRRLWAKAVYPFEITEAAEKVSQQGGNHMIELKVKITRPDDGAARTITDYLLEKTPEKLRHCAAACGLLDRYLSGSLSDSDLQGKRGSLRLGVEKKKGYPDRNIVADYVCEGAAIPGAGFFSGNGAKSRSSG